MVMGLPSQACGGGVRPVTAPYLSVLLPTYRQPAMLLLTLRDLAGQVYPRDRWELVVLDDGSRDPSALIAVAAFAANVPLTLHRMPLGGCYSHAKLFNEMLRLTSPGAEVFVHVEDVRVRSDFLAQHAKWHGGPGLRLVTGAMFEAPQESYERESCSRWNLMRMSGVESCAYECCFQSVFAKSMSYSTQLRELLSAPSAGGPFDAAMTGWGYQETEFAYRAALAGASCIYDLACGVYHPSHSTRDEDEYRKVDRARLKRHGTNANVRYLCLKHGISALPGWKVGVPTACEETPCTASR